MTNSELIDYIDRVIAQASWDVKVIIEQLKPLIANTKDATDRAHLQWEIVHLSNNFDEYRHDLQRIINTLDGKGLNANTKI